jgi:hypothetical protein
MSRGEKPSAKALAAAIRDDAGADLIRKMVHSGCSLRSTKLGDDPLMAAISKRDGNITQMLLDAGAAITPDEQSKLLCSVIVEEIAIRRDDPRSDETTLGTLDALLSHGVDVNARDAAGCTALRLAALYGKAEMVRWLLDRGAAPFVMDNYGRTPRDEAETALAQKKQRAQTLKNAMWLRAVPGLEQSIALLKEAEAATGKLRPPPPSAEDRWPILKTPVSQRRGLCDHGLETVNQLMIRADMDDLAGFLSKQPNVLSIESDVLPRKSKLTRPPAPMISLVKLKGQSWVYISGSIDRISDQMMREWSAALESPVLHGGAEDTSGVAYATLYRDGKVESKVQSRESDWTNVEEFLKRNDAYFTLITAGFAPGSNDFFVAAYHDDEALEQNIERIDLVFVR